MKESIFFIRKIFHKNGKWTEEEDKLIAEKGILCRNKKDWRSLSNILNKDPDKCMRRFNIKNPSIKKGKWTKEEDKKLMNLIDTYGKNWTKISKLFTSRNPKQVKNRFENSLNPILIKKKFSKEDDDLMKKLFDLFGNKWSMYLNYFPFCSIKRIKTRFMRIYVYNKESLYNINRDALENVNENDRNYRNDNQTNNETINLIVNGNDINIFKI
jgi:hypothetical protein